MVETSQSGSGEGSGRVTARPTLQWMGHSQMETTAIYANAVGEEQQSIAARMWAR
jgi:hypothetical protein